MSAVSACDIRVVLGGRRVLDGVNLALEPGRITAILGPNGSGKTTLVRSMVGLVPLASGHVSIAGRRLETLSRKEIARRVSYLPQTPEGSIALGVEQTVWMGRYPHLPLLGPPRAADHAAVEAALERVGVAHLRHRGLDEISGGERQRAALARSLATQADTWLLDEPTSSLDIAHALDILGLLRAEAERGRTIALVLHDLNLALRFCDRFALLRDGRLVAAGDASDTLRPERLEAVFGARFHLERVAGVAEWLVASPLKDAVPATTVRAAPSGRSGI